MALLPIVSRMFLALGTAFLFFLSPNTFAAQAAAAPVAQSDSDSDAQNSDLYYAAKSHFSEPKWFELRLGGGYDLSNPYLNIFSLQTSVYYLASADFAYGLEGTAYFSQKRSSTEILEQELNDFGYSVNTLSPEFSAVALFRITPISGLVNFFSSRILSADVSLIGRAGAIAYRTVGLGPVFGFALETHIGISPKLGVHSSIQWDFEKPGANAWQWRSGFRIGPSLKF
jgi:hypothetical protein